MKSSIFIKILLWFCITVIVCVAGSEISGRLRRFAPEHRDFFSRSISLQLDEARYAYETGGTTALQAYFTRLRNSFPGNYTLLDEHGIDVSTGIDHSDQLRHLLPARRWREARERLTIAWPSQDRKYRLLIDAVLPPGPPSPIPHYLWIIAASLAFSYVLAIHLASPLRKLEQTVERFGRGDLAVRASTRRKDEFGKLAAAFNVMADRTETLLTAERRLLQDVSHELRSPLARLQFAVELARTSADRGRAFNRIDKELKRLAELVSELLQVTRAESDPQTRNYEDISLCELVRDVLEDNSMEAHAQQRTLELKCVEDVSVRGDRELLRRAVENVFRNAIRYTPPGASVEASVQQNEGKAVISIRDFGSGVPEHSLTHLFEPFYRVEADRNRQDGGGVGLGLSIAQRAIAVHDGSIRARNASPGLLVEIQLPLSVVATGEPLATH